MAREQAKDIIQEITKVLRDTQEREVDEEIRTGQISAPQNLEDFINNLKKL